MNTIAPVAAAEFLTPKYQSATLEFKCLFTENVRKRNINN